MNFPNYNARDFGSDFGGAGHGSVAELTKAIQAGAITGMQTANQLFTHEPLKIESVEWTVRSLEFRMEDVKLWNEIPKMVASNTVEEYVMLESYGADGGGFYREGEMAKFVDSKYYRSYANVKYLQVAGNVTLQAQYVKSYVDALLKETENKTMWLIRNASRYLTYGDDRIVPEEWRGLFAQHGNYGTDVVYSSFDQYMKSDVLVDMRGKIVTQQTIENAANVIKYKYGRADSFYAPPKVNLALSQSYQDMLRAQTGDKAVPGIYGNQVKELVTNNGTVHIKEDIFMSKPDPKYVGQPAPSVDVPNPPSAFAAALTTADAESKFAAGETWTGELGTVFYAISAVNRFGESPLVASHATNKITLAAGLSVDLVFARAASGPETTGFIIYRSLVTSATNSANVPFYPLFRISEAQHTAGYDGGAANTVRDRNRFLPNTQEAFLTEAKEEIFSFKQLAPISKLNMGVVAPSSQFLMFMWGTPMLYAPKKMVRFINIGDRPIAS